MENLKRSAAAGARWSGASALVTAALQFGQFYALTWKLDPEEFGLMAMAMVVIAFMQTFVEFGISSALVYRQDVTPQQLSSLYIFSLGAGAVGFSVALAIVPLCAWFFQTPELYWVLPWCGLTFLLGTPGQLYAALLQKNLRFRALSKVEILTQACGFAVAVLLAWRGAGVMALVGSLLATTLARTLLVMRTGLSLWRPAWHFCAADLRGFIGFGAYQTASGILNFALMRMDQLLLGRLLGKVVLGHYNFAYNLVMQPISRINPILTRVAFPVFARLQNDNRKLKAGFFIVCRVLLTMTAPMLVGLAGVMKTTIGVVFQPKWMASVELVEVLAFVTLFRCFGNPFGSLLLAKGRADMEFKWNILVVVVQIIAITLGARLGHAIGVAIGLLAVQLLLVGLAYWKLIRPLLGPCGTEYLRALTAPLIPAFVMGGVLFLLPTDIVGLPRAISLVIQILLGAAIYLIQLLLFQRQFLRKSLAMFYHS